MKWFLANAVVFCIQITIFNPPCNKKSIQEGRKEGRKEGNLSKKERKNTR